MVEFLTMIINLVPFTIGMASLYNIERAGSKLSGGQLKSLFTALLSLTLFGLIFTELNVAIKLFGIQQTFAMDVLQNILVLSFFASIGYVGFYTKKIAENFGLANVGMQVAERAASKTPNIKKKNNRTRKKSKR